MSQTLNELITIGITAYNEGKYLQEAWDSVVNQNDNRWEAVMILDGGSDKETTEIFNKIVHKSLTKIKLDSNHGPYDSRTIAIKNTKTEWYCQLDGDDLLPKNFTSLVLGTINNNPDADIIYGDIQYLRGKKKAVTRYDSTGYKLLPFLLYGHVPIKSSIFFELGGFEKKLAYGGADRDFLIRCAIHKKNFICCIPGGILYIVRKRDNSVSSLRSGDIKKRKLIFDHLNRNYAKFYRDNDYYDEFIKKNVKPIFFNYFNHRNYIKLINYLFVFGSQSNFFLYKYFFRLISK